MAQWHPDRELLESIRLQERLHAIGEESDNTGSRRQVYNWCTEAEQLSLRLWRSSQVEPLAVHFRWHRRARLCLHRPILCFRDRLAIFIPQLVGFVNTPKDLVELDRQKVFKQRVIEHPKQSDSYNNGVNVWKLLSIPVEDQPIQADAFDASIVDNLRADILKAI